MITIIHGEDTQKSREYFLSIKKNTEDPTSLDGVTLTVEQISQLLQGNSLFGDATQIFIEDFITKKKQGKDVEKIIALMQEDTSNNIYLWESKQLTVKQLSIFQQKEVHLFKTSAILFKFLDKITPGKGLELINLLRTQMKREEDQLIFFMLVRHIRILLALKYAGKNSIDEIKKIPSWQQAKLEKQASLFPGHILIKLYSQLFLLDYQQKTGTLSMPFSSQLDFILGSL